MLVCLVDFAWLRLEVCQILNWAKYFPLKRIHDGNIFTLYYLSGSKVLRTVSAWLLSFTLLQDQTEPSYSLVCQLRV